MRIFPIRSEQDHGKALSRIEVLMDKNRSSAEEDELDVLATLVAAYEEKRFPIQCPTPVAVIQFVMDQRGLRRKDLEDLLGSRARVSEILNGRRPLTLTMIRRLSASWGISADLLIQEPQSRRGRRPTHAPRTARRTAA
ncbi:helix-turn-helix domain-containing protein [Edaphobacter bradus]|uniref:helix-turn-helix domain-containing protein n=1 Tax=Edaphobacter bradus TaxID=2259016 RepID=UPI0021E0F00B|nr:helix-turn-helix domain-containing protein [Edaphobacter bradus]